MQITRPEDTKRELSDGWRAHYLKVREKYPSGYISPPVRLASMLDADDLGPDTFRKDVRYEQISAFLRAHQPLDRLVDIGGNCGYFALSLLDEGLVKEAVVYDVAAEVLAFGEEMATELGLGARCTFVNEPISLDKLDQLPDGDVIICQYLIHHAGKLFDEDLVRSLGWEAYALRFLERLREKFRFGVIGNAYKSGKPTHWKVAQCQRPAKFQALLENAGWRVQFQRSLYEMVTGQQSLVDLTAQENSPAKHFLLRTAWQLGGRRAERKLRSLLFRRPIDKTENYFLYLTEGGREEAHVDNQSSRTSAG